MIKNNRFSDDTQDERIERLGGRPGRIPPAPLDKEGVEQSEVGG